MKVCSVWCRCCQTVLMCSFLVFAHGNLKYDVDKWIDPYDMLNYDPASKSMKNAAETTNNNHEQTKRREYSDVVSSEVKPCPDNTLCARKLERLQREFKEHKQTVLLSSQQPTCHPVFRRFLAKLLKEIQKLDFQTDVNAPMHYDAEVKLSKQRVLEIQKLLSDDGSWNTGALDDALSQILINFKVHDYEAWKWHFEDTFGVELDTVFKISLCVFIILAITSLIGTRICSWFGQIKGIMAICFIISLVWNWIYLYKISNSQSWFLKIPLSAQIEVFPSTQLMKQFSIVAGGVLIASAKHQANMVKLENVHDKCTGLTTSSWIDILKDWIRVTWTLQDDPCEEYYTNILVNTIWLVSPLEASVFTIFTFITVPLKYLGQGIREFYWALLKDLPVQHQILILVFIYFIVKLGLPALVTLRGGQGKPQPPAIQQPHHALLRNTERQEDAVLRAGRDADCAIQRKQYAEEGAPNRNRNKVRQRRLQKPREEQPKKFDVILRNADNQMYETDNQTETKTEGSASDAENKSLNDIIAKEEHEESTHNSGMPKSCQPTSKGQID